MTFGPLEIGVACAVAFVWTWLVFRLGSWAGVRIRRSSVEEGARRQLAGRAAELFAPFDDGFPADPDDAWFLGAPIDYVVFDGMSRGEVEQVVFVEVKTGGGKLTRRERQIRDAVREGRVRWVELRRDPR